MILSEGTAMAKMLPAVLTVGLCVVGLAASVTAQRRGSGGGSVTFAVNVTDPDGAPITDAMVSVKGPAQRSARTENGRLAFEGLPSGSYHFRFEKDGFVAIDRDVVGRGSAPIDVKVTLTPVPAPPKPIATVPVPQHLLIDSKPVALDLPTYIEKNYVGRSPGKATSVACAPGGAADVLQINEPVKEHTHGDGDEFVYVIAGQGNARVGGLDEPMSGGMFLLVPRGVPHSFSAGPKKPLVVLSILAGGKCAG
jgi:mannose-6-phosphate isomerase-like protein (cupin superfamily)